MRLNDHLLLQELGSEGYVIIDETDGTEMLLAVDEAGRLLVGLGWFAHSDPALDTAAHAAAQEAGFTVVVERRTP